MSRIGKLPVEMPDKVEAKINGNHVAIKGPNGQLESVFSKLVNISLEEKRIIVTPIDESKAARSQWGTVRTVINNMVLGVTTGFKKVLEFNGVGYKALANGDSLTLSLGYSHPIEYQLPTGIKANVAKNVIEISGIDKELIGFVAAKIRSFRPPEPYKGKGIKYIDEVIVKKAGKSGGK